MSFAPIAPIAHEPGEFEDSQVFGDGRLRYACAAREAVYRLLSIAGYPFKDGPTGGIGERPE
jgi:hypothetical protein